MFNNPMEGAAGFAKAVVAQGLLSVWAMFWSGRATNTLEEKGLMDPPSK